VDIQNIISFVTASVVLTLMPGPDNIYVLIESITRGYKTGIAISTGLISGIIIHTSIASTGLAVIFMNSELSFGILKYAGALYLLFLAFQAYREKIRSVTIQSENRSEDLHFLKLFKRGFLMNVMNPKVTLFFIAFLPQFVSSDGYKLSTQMIILGIIFMGQAMLIFSIISVLAGKLASGIQNRTFWRVTKWLKIIILAFLSFGLIYY
jgi:threonine/homoserine/homoserine lactone efflux protein